MQLENTEIILEMKRSRLLSMRSEGSRRKSGPPCRTTARTTMSIATALPKRVRLVFPADLHKQPGWRSTRVRYKPHRHVAAPTTERGGDERGRLVPLLM